MNSTSTTPLIAFGLLFAAPLAAQQENVVSLNGPLTNFSTAPRHLQVESVHPCQCTSTLRAAASSDSGRLQLRTEFVNRDPSGLVGDFVAAGYRLHDLVFSAPPGVTSTDVTFYLTLHDVEQGGAGAHYVNSLILYAQLGPWSPASSGSAVLSNIPGYVSSGVLSSYGWNDAVVAFGPYSVPTNVPVLLYSYAQISAQAVTGSTGNVSCTVALGQGYTDSGGPYQVFDLEPGITVNSASGSIVDNQWSPASEVGYRFCEPLAPNSAGTNAWIHAIGSNDVTANDTTLVITGLPMAGTTAMLVNSRAAWAGVSNPASGGVPSDGRICIGGSTLGRHGASIYMGTAGTFSVPLDLAALPHPVSPSSYSAAVVAGETWYWQCWYRDSTLGPGRSNFSGAIGIRFE